MHFSGVIFVEIAWTQSRLESDIGWLKLYYSSFSRWYLIMPTEPVLQISQMHVRAPEYTPNTGSESRKLQVELKAVRLTASIVGVFIVLWTPFIVGRIIVASGINPLLGQYVSDVGATLGVFHSSLNWVVYGLASRDFRRAVVKTIIMRCMHNWTKDIVISLHVLLNSAVDFVISVCNKAWLYISSILECHKQCRVLLL